MALDLAQAKTTLATLVSGPDTTNDLLNPIRQVDTIGFLA